MELHLTFNNPDLPCNSSQKPRHSGPLTFNN